MKKVTFTSPQNCHFEKLHVWSEYMYMYVFSVTVIILLIEQKEINKQLSVLVDTILFEFFTQSPFLVQAETLT